MEKLKMHSLNKVDENIANIGKLFPNCLTERKNEKGKLEYAIDFDLLKQELSTIVVESNEEHYKFTWPDKKKSILLANAPIAKTLRPCRSESLHFDQTENLYLEGDNLDILKLLRETYLGKIKMIYIDPPFNTGNDFVYEDDFSMSLEEYMNISANYDDEGNHMVKNLDSNGRFHTDWLNMIYPRLKVAKDLLTDDGVIFISINDCEMDNLRKICNDIFGASNFVATLVWKSRQNKDNRNITGVSIDHEYILCYSRFTNTRAFRGSDRKTDRYSNPDNDSRGDWTSSNMVGMLSEELRPNCHYDLIDSRTEINYGRPKMGWRYDSKTMRRLIREDRIIWPSSPTGRPRRKVFLSEIADVLAGYSSIVGESLYTRSGTAEITSLFNFKSFDYPKPSMLIKEFILQSTKSDSIILDFFSGSATTAQATMQLNAEDGGSRKFIMVQLPEGIDTKSEAYKEGYSNICDIGKERIHRVGRKIVHAQSIKHNYDLNSNNCAVDVGFRVLKLDSTNMKEVSYGPVDYSADLFSSLTDNIKYDRTPEDLLFQVMLDLGILLSSKIDGSVIDGKKVFNVDNNYLIACFDDDVTSETVKAIAQRKPHYAVLRDSSMANDSVATNFEQIFATYSPETIRKVL